MGKNKTIFWFGIAVLLVPFLGVPVLWKEYLLIILGVSLCGVSITRAKNDHVPIDTNTSPGTFVENKGDHLQN